MHIQTQKESSVSPKQKSYSSHFDCNSMIVPGTGIKRVHLFVFPL